jgi:hypothetical protein
MVCTLIHEVKRKGCVGEIHELFMCHCSAESCRIKICPAGPWRFSNFVMTVKLNNYNSKVIGFLDRIFSTSSSLYESQRWHVSASHHLTASKKICFIKCNFCMRKCWSHQAMSPRNLKRIILETPIWKQHYDTQLRWGEGLGELWKIKRTGSPHKDEREFGFLFCPYFCSLMPPNRQEPSLPPPPPHPFISNYLAEKIQFSVHNLSPPILLSR